MFKEDPWKKIRERELSLQEKVSQSNKIRCPFCFGDGKLYLGTMFDPFIIRCEECAGNGVIEG